MQDKNMVTNIEDKKRLRVMVLFGGRSEEHDVSVLSATNILSAMGRTKYEPVPVYVGRDGRWRLSSFLRGNSPSQLKDPASLPSQVGGAAY